MALVPLFVGGCSSIAVSDAPTPVHSLAISAPLPTPEPSRTVESAYRGVTIDQAFPQGYEVSFTDTKGNPPETFEIGGYIIHSKNYVPLSLKKDGRAIFKFPSRETGGYWATLAGVSQLRGKGSKEIYFTVSGPGAVCCTNYTIVDISASKPRAIYHTEDFGQFRNAMEVFDVDNDGTYELVQFDSCLRYFRGDCGSCSPEPRVYFKYRRDIGKYWPVKGVLQDFVRESFAASDKWIVEKYSEWRSTNDASLAHDLHRSVVAHIADLLHVGEERKAWSLFEKYSGIVDAVDRRELKKRLRHCKAYSSLKAFRN